MLTKEIQIEIDNGGFIREVNVNVSEEPPKTPSNGQTRYSFDEYGKIKALAVVVKNFDVTNNGVAELDTFEWVPVQGVSTIDQIIYNELLKREMIKVNSDIYVELSKITTPTIVEQGE